MESLSELELPAEKNFAYQSNGFLFLGRQCDVVKGKAKYTVSVTAGDLMIGRFTFFVSDDNEVVFEGMYIKPESRNRGISKIFIKELFQIAAASNRNFHQTTSQRKPLMCRILDKQGFSPLIHDARKEFREAVFVGRGEDPTRIYVNFPSVAKQEEFRRSKIFAAQHYEIVDSIEDIRDAVRCILNTPYVLSR